MFKRLCIVCLREPVSRSELKPCRICGVPQGAAGLTEEGTCRDHPWCERTQRAGTESRRAPLDGDPVPAARPGRPDPGRECSRCNATFYGRGTIAHCAPCSKFLNSTIRRWVNADDVVRLPAEDFAAHLGITVDVLHARISRMRSRAV